MEHSNTELNNYGATSNEFLDLTDATLSPDSEYDEELAFPEDNFSIVTVGQNPVLVKKQNKTQIVSNGDHANDSSSSDEEVDTRTTYIKPPRELPYNYIYSVPIKFNSFDRKIFIPGTQIHVSITNYERSMTTHLLNPILYTIQLQHGSFIWTIKKRYKDFVNLHNSLRMFRTSLNFPLPSRTHREIRSSFRNNHKISISTISNSNIANDASNDTTTNKKKQKKKRKKGSLPRFPKRPDTLLSVDQIPSRIKQLENYLYNLLNITLYRNHHDTINFLQVSNFSFIAALGEKGRELMIKKRTGSTNPGHKKCNLLGCFSLGCCIRCNYFCSESCCSQWQQRWLFVKETCFGLIRPKDGIVRSVILFDQGFETSLGMYSTGLRSGLQILTNSRYIVIKYSSKKIAKDWNNYFKQVANSTARDFTSPNPHNSFAPVRTSTLASWFVDGANHMSAVADALEGALEEIFIADWWLSPEIYMKRPTLDGEYWRLDKILLRKARQGVKIFILLYKEVEMALGLNSYYSKQRLVQLHENIKVLRHPDHVRVGVFFWAHHEKLVVVDQTYAFVGGIDLAYGRWDDHKHRLTDLGSISITAKQANRRSYMTIENPLRSLIVQSTEILQATATANTNRDNLSVTTQESLTITTTKTKKVTLRKDKDKSENEEELNEHTKRDTPEMKRKGITEKIKDNVKSTGKELINRLTLNTDGGSSGVVEAPVMIKVESVTEEIPPAYFELDGQAKLWIGKDYTNFIFKDFTELNQPFTDLVDRNKMPRMPWHDISSVVVGAAARDVARHFIMRWNASKLEKARENLSYPYLMPKSYNDIRVDANFWNKSKVNLERVTVQVLRSASNWSAGFIENDYLEQSIHEAYVETISRAQHYIYIENQFFISLGFPDAIVKNQIAESLYKRIVRAHREKKVFRVYVVLPLLPGFEGDVAGNSGIALRIITHWNYASICRAENSIFKRLLKAGIKNPLDYISFHSLRNHSTLNEVPITELIYVHSKLMIVDDRTVIVGSANINDRSMLGKRDSEMAIIVNDEAFHDGKMNGETFPTGNFAGSLRRYLFREHLGLLEQQQNDDGEDEIDINDPISDAFFKDTWQKISKENSSIFDEVFKCIPNNAVRTIATLKKYNDEPALSKADPEKAAEKLKSIQGYLVDLPLDFLCDEDLTPPTASKEGILSHAVWT
ncbi:phospholipase D1-like isoform X4 [Chironomus tepperi]